MDFLFHNSLDSISLRDTPGHIFVQLSQENVSEATRTYFVGNMKTLPTNFFVNWWRVVTFKLSNYVLVSLATWGSQLQTIIAVFKFGDLQFAWGSSWCFGEGLESGFRRSVGSSVFRFFLAAHG